ncbi:hypothetical protein GLAREA_08209 [Glarea lozoyensis ATCC 20868]|uniref:Xylanolytic transcriptional activator regulatory domain-containing protein n=1 Tax=Glarea lozoyensis (strain ATCC 20868 / MF5171) TaxID=1116229 RepID=S3CCU9_GLAL2|nr:uncharacterized protein GLAREA_08209 [Glarea lozoyensis ATCC 20868]EPE24357.1 hypothetical protein GLAREA_08209 [Glarea lozoyensis ATCC 20868]
MASRSPISAFSGREGHEREPRVQLPYPEINREPVPPAPAPLDIGTTLPRSLDDIMLAQTEIDEIFALYFQHYARHLPFLDFARSESPNSFYDQSPLLFWAIITAGARRYQRNPSLLGSLATPLLKLGWSSMQISAAVIPNIQGLLILSTWPFPTNTTSKDNTFTLSGMAVNLALQIGLHVPLQGQEYSRTRVDLSSEGLARRVQLWSYCVVVHQKAACGLGYPITLPLDLFQKKIDVSGLTNLAPRSLTLEVRLASIVGRINSVFSEFNFDNLGQQAQVAPTMMLDVFEAQLSEIESDNTDLTDLECLYLQIARLQLRIYYLRCPENETFPLNLAKLYTTATGIINLVSTIDTRTSNFATYVPHHVYRMMTLAAAAVLRVLKTTLSEKLQERESGKAAFFTAIALLRKMSVYNNDMPSRMQGIFSQLWESERAFKPDEGSRGSTALRIQSRLSMSLLHDTMWWWREEFGGVQETKPKPTKDSLNPPTPSKPPPTSNQQNIPITPLPLLEGTALPGPADINLDPNVPLDNIFLNDESLDFLWAQPDHGFESMVELFPDSWPL